MEEGDWVIGEFQRVSLRLQGHQPVASFVPAVSVCIDVVVETDLFPDDLVAGRLSAVRCPVEIAMRLRMVLSPNLRIAAQSARELAGETDLFVVRVTAVAFRRT